MKRGDIVTTALRGDYGKPRPALVVQSDLFETDSVTLLLITSTLQTASFLRVDISPTEANGLRKPSQVQIDRLISTPRERIGAVVGSVSSSLLQVVDRRLVSFLALVP